MSAENTSPAPPVATTEENAHVEAEADDYDDGDSAFGPNSVASSTTSIGSSILKYRTENGRTYHSYKDGKYILPNDEDEKDRLDLQHHLYSLTFGGKLYLCPFPKDKQIHRVLDVGTGTGIWAIDFADENPGSQVFGVDLSPIQPQFVPPNVTFEVDDIEEPWTFSHKFDFIHARMMTGSLADWPAFFKQSFEFLTPGGMMQVSDLSFPVKVDDDSWPPNSALKKWGELIVEAGVKLGRPCNSAETSKEQMVAAGFQDVVEIQFKWPLNRWPKDKKYKEWGMWNHENIAGGLYGVSVALFTRGLGWTVEELELFLVDVRKEIKDTKIHSYFPLNVVYGQKP